MVVILIRWYVKNEKADEFVSYWENIMKVNKGKGLFRETLCKVNLRIENPKFHTFNLDNPFYITFINVGMWESVEAFDKAVSAPYIKPAITNDGEKYLQLLHLNLRLGKELFLRKYLQEVSPCLKQKWKNESSFLSHTLCQATLTTHIQSQTKSVLSVV